MCIIIFVINRIFTGQILIQCEKCQMAISRFVRLSIYQSRNIYFCRSVESLVLLSAIANKFEWKTRPEKWNQANVGGLLSTRPFIIYREPTRINFLYLTCQKHRIYITIIVIVGRRQWRALVNFPHGHPNGSYGFRVYGFPVRSFENVYRTNPTCSVCTCTW